MAIAQGDRVAPIRRLWVSLAHVAGVALLALVALFDVASGTIQYLLDWHPIEIRPSPIVFWGAACLAAAVGVVWLGYRLKDIELPQGPSAMRQDGARLWAVYGHAIKVAIAQQLIASVFAGLCLDQGERGRRITAAAMAWAISTYVIVLRRIELPTRVDLWMVKYGLWIWLLIADCLAGFIRASQ